MDDRNERRPEEPACEGTRTYPTYHPIDAVRAPLVRDHRIDEHLRQEQIARWLSGGTP